LIEIDINRQDIDDGKVFENLVKQSILQTLSYEGVDFNGEVSVLFVDETQMAEYNMQYRQKEGATDVLSFPLNTTDPSGYVFLGDIVINIDRAKQQAAEYGHSAEREVAFLTVHSTLHLLGYGHDDVMFVKQEEILQKMELTR